MFLCIFVCCLLFVVFGLRSVCSNVYCVLCVLCCVMCGVCFVVVIVCCLWVDVQCVLCSAVVCFVLVVVCCLLFFWLMAVICICCVVVIVCHLLCVGGCVL